MAVLALTLSFCAATPAFAAQMSAEVDSSSVAVKEIAESSEAAESEEKPAQEDAKGNFSETSKAEEKTPMQKSNLKPAVFTTEAVVTVEAEDSADTTDFAESESEAGIINRSAMPAASAKPVLTLEKKQAVNDGEATTDTVTASPGDTITYYLTVTNSEESDCAAEEVSVTDNIPKGMTYVEGSASGEATISGGVIRWIVDSLPAGQSVLVSYQAYIPEDADAATYSSTANASCSLGNADRDSPKTGDSSNAGTWIAVAGLSLAVACAGGCSLYRMRKRYE